MSLDFLEFSVKRKPSSTEISPKFMVKKSNDLMIRGQDFYAIWVADKGMWSTDEGEAIRLIDEELDIRAEEERKRDPDSRISVMYLRDTDTKMIDKFHKYCKKDCRDSFHVLDEKIIFSNDKSRKTDYASKRLTYPLEEGDISAYDELMEVLYSPEERQKIEWAIGSIVQGDSKKIQKFMVLYGAAGTGKSTVLNIIQMLFDGYYTVFDAKALGSGSSSFALEPFKTNPLVAIQHDGDLSKIEDNTRLNSLVAHEEMTVNEKFKNTYSMKFKCFLFMGTNKPVKITDGKSGLLRRLIDVSPTGKKLSLREYNRIMKQITFELGAIAYHCKEVYLKEPDKYDGYIPITMLGASNDFYGFVEDNYSVFARDDHVTLAAAWELYNNYCEKARVSFPYSNRVFREELKNYFWNYTAVKVDENGTKIRNYYSGFRTDRFESMIFSDSPQQPKEKDPEPEPIPEWLVFKEQPSILDEMLKDCPAQYANQLERPIQAWDNVKTTLKDLNTALTHYVRPPLVHVVTDFDKKDEKGKKSLKLNIEAASKWPKTYAELSKSGQGIHLHYIFNGDVSKLNKLFDEDIEIKVFTGNSSLRRKLTKCNDIPVTTITSGLPMKKEGKKVVNWEGISNERVLRSMIKKNLSKSYHSATKPSVDYIYALLEDTYNKNISYDVSDMKNDVIAFAANSTNNADYCLKLTAKMHFRSKDMEEADKKSVSNSQQSGSDVVPIFYDIEVAPNVLLVCWKKAGDNPVIRMYNPEPEEIESLLRMCDGVNYGLVGFNCRRYDNHILHARLIHYDNTAIFNLSNSIINSKKGENRNIYFGPAYNYSYLDLYDVASKKQSLKKWEIEMQQNGIEVEHEEFGFPWDQPVPEELWGKLGDYCENDVRATEKLYYLKSIQADITARKILADLANGSLNDTTNSLTTKIIFGNERHPQLVYTDLSETFPGYEMKEGKNIYRNTDIGFGGYIMSNPGAYGNVALLDISSMHPHSIKALNCFGEYTKNFTDLLDARIAIKHKDFDSARKMLNGKLAPYLDDPSSAKDLAQALKIAINSVYGLTAASFDNPFRDIRNKNNIVALRGALFMRTLQDEVESRGFKIVAIKTDSIKIADATKDIIDFCMDFAKKYGYTFEHEATYDRICQVNDADYIARYRDKDLCMQQYNYIPSENEENSNKWTATGKQFQIPYVFKSLFSHEPLEFYDFTETKEVKTALYLDMNETLPEGQHDYRFVGKVGLFCPVKPGSGGGELLREAADKDGNIKYDSAAGAKGYRWIEAELLKTTDYMSVIDRSYFDKLVNDAVYGADKKKGVAQYCDFEWFVSEEPYISKASEDLPFYFDDDDRPPWDTSDEEEDQFRKR